MEETVERESYTWFHEDLVFLIEFWENEECLYNSKCASYLDNNILVNAVTRIVNSVNELGISVNSDDAVPKTHDLRIYYSATFSN